MKNLFLLVLSLLFINLGYSQDNLYLPIANGEVISHSNYTFSYIETYEQAEWVAYELTTEETVKLVRRSNRFKSDPYVLTGSATLKDYKSSGYDRGHLAPAADMGFSSIAMNESFYMSNMSPQAPSFNRGAWKKLESLVRSYAKQYGKIYVVTGPILTKGLPTIGNNHVAIPQYYYKIILIGEGDNQQMIAFLLRNEKSSDSLSKFVVNTDCIETLTGIDFFPQLPDDLEEKLESGIDKSNWYFKVN
ncbi:DNA/RNA non-specific endonuclease [Ancylomarina sp. 16SWW S1-10-2]|uniref:DNA/RNA non-specific endonuclease n=1 Tax=Ancylomarina sp. 16SWW S1-10-2 TaxID=2499681 RepID=UPI0012ADE14C|nr:DNA/RNA non-specific endonuclease [Ancylomarina sp. 16SWW S1-10-2]MRT91663.1 DNA/RNA non-specific endonuclease [Ancylomarina sp. 16SWW S1-10-2]